MFVTVKGQQVEAAVSEGGMFYDVATKKITAPTLKGLEKKLRTQELPKGGGVPVEDWSSGKKGMVTGRVKTKGWRRSYFTIAWEDGTSTESSGFNLCPILPPGVREEAEKLDVEQASARLLSSKAGEDVTNFRYKYRIEKDLDAVFPLGK